jgi:hypothetical protein
MSFAPGANLNTAALLEKSEVKQAIINQNALSS